MFTNNIFLLFFILGMNKEQFKSSLPIAVPNKIKCIQTPSNKQIKNKFR